MPPSRSLAAGAVIALALAAPVAARAATISVTTTADVVAADGVCSLREAITAANTNAAGPGPGECAAGEAAAPDRIVLPAGVYRRAIDGAGEDGNATGDLDVTGPVEILGAGSAVTTIDADGKDRVIDVRTAGPVRIADVTLTGGRTVGGPAAAPVAGTPGVTDPLTGGAGGPAEDGAGVRNVGTLTIERSRITGNVAGAGGRGGDATGAGGVGDGQGGGTATGGRGGDGGAGGIWSSGALTLSSSVVSGNRGGAGGAGGAGRGGNGASGLSAAPGGAGVGGAGGDGGPGGIEATGPLTIRDSAILGNGSGAGGEGGEGAGGAAGPGTEGQSADGGGGTGGAGGAGGAGGGIRAAAATSLERVTLASNTTGPGGRGGRGRGGARSGTAADIGPGIGGAGGAGGAGGGLAAAGGTAGMVNVTLAGNITAGGGGGGGGGATFEGGPGSAAGAGGPGGAGGGLAAGGGTVDGAFVTVAGNGAGGAGTAGRFGDASTPGTTGPAGSPGNGAGAAIAADAPVSLAASVVSNNACTGTVAVGDGGGNLAQSAPGCPGAPGDARLGPLTANGGVPPTLALGAGSTAVDSVPAVIACPATDARGATRPVGARCDAGAYEVAPPAATTGGVTLSGTTARISGTVATRGLPTSVRVQIGTTAAYGTDTPLVGIPGDAAPTAVAVSVGGLVPLQTYHYRVVATGPDGTVAGADRAFTVPRSTATTAAAKPRLRGVTIAPRRFAPMARGGLRQAARKGRPARGAVITFRLSKRATVQITAARVLRGRMVRAGKRVRCRPVAAKVVVPKGRRCTAVRTLGTIRRNGSAGRNRFVMTGRVGARVLPAGTYRLTFRATDADGQRSPVVRRTITILPVPRQPPRRSKASG